MPVKMKCPNSECARTLSIKDKYAGRRGRCPFCGGKIEVPDLNGVLPKPAVKWAQNRADRDEGDGFEVIEEDDEDEEEEEAEARQRSSARRKQARPRPAEDEEDAAAVDEDDDTKIPHRSGKKAAARSRSKSAAKKIERPRETPSEASSSTSRPRPRRRVAFDEPKPDRNAAIMLGVCAFFLLVLGLSTLLPWINVYGGGDATSTRGISTLSGQVMLGISALACLIAGGAAIAYRQMPVKAANDMAAIAAAAAGGWASACSVWLIGWLWKGYGSGERLHEIISRRGSPLNMALLPPDSPLAGHVYGTDLKISLGSGLWVGLAMGLLVVGVFTHLLGTRQRGGALLVCPMGGLLVGAVLLIYAVHPWDTFMAVAK